MEEEKEKNSTIGDIQEKCRLEIKQNKRGNIQNKNQTSNHDIIQKDKHPKDKHPKQNETSTTGYKLPKKECSSVHRPTAQNSSGWHWNMLPQPDAALNVLGVVPDVDDCVEPASTFLPVGYSML